VFVDKDDSVTASNKASSGFASGRQCPDLCGICGQNPKGILIALPTQAGSTGDGDLAGPGFPNFDETSPNDGWAVASGTSAAAAMVAGVAALVMQNDPVMAGNPPMAGNPANVRAALVASCLDVTAGKSANNEPAGPGRDNATGAGLVQAYRAVRTTDLWVKDNPDSDMGWVPTHNRRPAWPPFAHWVSPDIKVFSAPLMNPDVTFDPTPAESPVFGQDNFVYVRVRNRGIGPSPQVNTRLYYADPATNLVFPADWNDGQSGIPANGSLTVNGVATNLQTFPNVPAGGQNVLPLPFVWRPPDPTTATRTQLHPNGRLSGHFCLLVRLESADDPIIVPGGGQASVIDDNNIGMANQDVYSGPPGAPFRFTFVMRGDDLGPARYDLLFDLRRLPRKSAATVELRGQLRGRAQLVNAMRSEDRLRLEARQTPAGLRGLTLAGDSRTLVRVSVEMPPRTPPGDYPISVLQASHGHALGGMTLVARVT
jgi:hypothetical protein